MIEYGALAEVEIHYWLKESTRWAELEWTIREKSYENAKNGREYYGAKNFTLRCIVLYCIVYLNIIFILFVT